MLPLQFLGKCLSILLIASHSQLLYAASKAIEPVMVDIPGGQLTVYSANANTNTRSHARIESPHKVLINPFRMGKYEVTIKEFGQFIAATQYPAPTLCRQMDSQKWFAERPGNWQGNKHSSSEFEPVTCIGWDVAQAYVDWLSKETGKHYRLPSEAEWEYAARAGTNTTYYWGDEPAQACAYANIADQAAEAAIKRDYDGLESKDHVGVVPCNDKAGYASVVGIYQPNAFGLHDMIGNINEFTGDCFNEDYPGNTTDGSLRSSGDCSQRILRGGSWHWAPFSLGARAGLHTDFIGSLEGFRVAEDIRSNGSNTMPSANEDKQVSRNTQFRTALKRAQKAAY